MKKTFVVALIAWLLPTTILADKPINNLVGVEIPMHLNGDPLSMEEVRSGIVAGCKFKGWVPVLTDEGRIEASIRVRSHTAKVEITFDTRAYSITYLSSTNLDYNAKKQKIHRNYNKWVNLLSEAIDYQLINKI